MGAANIARGNPTVTAFKQTLNIPQREVPDWFEQSLIHMEKNGWIASTEPFKYYTLTDKALQDMSQDINLPKEKEKQNEQST